MQGGETSNGIPVEKNTKKAEKSSGLVNGSTEENGGEKDHTREAKQKRKKRKHDGEIKKEQGKQDKDCIKEKKEEKRKRKNYTEDVLNVGSCLGEEVTCKEDKVESKKKKKKKSLVDISNTAIISEDSNSDHNDECKKLTITNGSNKSEEHESRKSLVNGSSQSEMSSVNGGDTRLSPEKEDRTSFRTPIRKVLHKAASSSSEPFAKFQKNSTPPAFVRKCLAKTPSTEPQQSKSSKLKVGDSFLFDVMDIIQRD